MALTSLQSPVIVPGIWHTDTLNNTIVTINATGEKAGCVFSPVVAGDITAIHWRTQTVTTGKTVKVGIQTVSNGLPSGTWVSSGNAYGTQAVADGDDNTYFTTTLGTAATVAPGSDYAVVIEWDNDADPGNMNIVSASTNVFVRQALGISTCVAVSKTGASWAVTGANYLSLFGLSYGGTYHPHPYLPPPGVYATLNLEADGTTFDETGNRFKVPFGCRCIGLVTYMDLDYSSTLSLYPDSGSALAETTVVNRGGTAIGHTVGFFSSPVTLSANTWYRMTTRNSSNTSQTIGNITYGDTAAMRQAGLTDCYRCYRVDSGSWNDTLTTQRVLIALIIDQVDLNEGTPDFPDVGNVLSDDTVNGSAGTYVGPAITDVKNGVQYGAGGTEYTGTYTPSGGGGGSFGY